MSKLVINPIVSGFPSVATLNANFEAIEAALENTVSRDGTTPNHLTADLDMNGHRILNALASTGEGFVWRGTWTTGLNYTINDLVYSSGSSYICTISHIATVFGTDLGAGKWQIIAAKGESGDGTGDMLKEDNLAGLASVETSRANIGAASSGANSDITSLSGLTTPLSIEQGGTGSSLGIPTIKNLLINGAMRVSQRWTSASVSGTDVFVCDRWRTQTNGGGTVTVSKNATSVLQQRYFLRSEYSSGTVSGVVYRQRIESKEVNGLHIVGSVTASLKAYQNTGSSQTWTISLYKPTAGDDNYSSGETLISSQNITVGSGGWSSHSMTFSGLVEADVVNGLALRITTGALTSGKVNGISEVQLEVGSAATEFERRPYGLELALCQRYFQIVDQMTGWYAAPTSILGTAILPVNMRAMPTVSANGALSFLSPINNTQSNQSAANAVIASYFSSTKVLYLSCGNFSGLTNNYYVMNANSSVIYADSEL